MQAIVLAGGLGTRLRSVVQDLPKPMAPINGKPFLVFVLEYLKKQGITEIILSVSYKHELIQEYFKDEFCDMKIHYNIEKELLGTGGAIKDALKFVKNKVYVLNGDTFFDVDLKKLILNGSKICIALKQMQNFDRYGTVNVDEQGIVTSFEEKMFKRQGLINGGVYLIKKNIFDEFSLEDKFSFEGFLQENHKSLKIQTQIFDDYFIDIGVPEDYQNFCNFNYNI